MTEIRVLRDYETRCEISVVDVGVWQYVLHPSHEVLCVSWRVKENGVWGPVFVAIVIGGKDGRRAVERRVEERGFVVRTLEDFFADQARATVNVAHNTGFEQGVEYRHFPHLKPLESYWSCTASRARRLGLPGSLEDACKVLRTPHQKSIEGHGSMLQVSQPRPQWRSAGIGDKYFDDAERLAKNAIYCGDDIYAECDLDDYFPELPPQERHFWEQTERRNQRGIRLDRPLIETMSHVVTSSSESMVGIARKITGNPEFNLTDVNAIRAFCGTRGVYLADMRAATVAAVLDRHRSGDAKIDEEAATILEARQQVGGKSSNSKLVRMRQRMGVDDCARDIAIYHGAHTGRMTGEGINVLNLPKPYEGFDQDFVVECLMKQELARLRAEQKVAPAVAVSAALRGVIIPRPGKKLVIADYATVEPCCLFTMARQWDAVEALRRREDLYCMFGSDILGRKINKKDDPLLRSVFKSAVLGAGFQMGLPRFLSYLEANKVFVSEDIARLAHEGYRKRFPKVPEFWNGVHEAAKSAIRSPGRVFSYNDITYHSDGWWLVCTLPSGRPFMYPHVRLLPGKFNDEITYEGWVRIDGRPAGWGDVRTFGGMLTENLTQSICRDIMEEDKDEIEQLPGWNVLLDVYDELVAEAPIDERDAVPRMLGIMGRSPTWFPMMPVAAEGFEAMRYRKQD